MEDRALSIQISGDGVSPAGQLTEQHVGTRGLVYSGHLLVNGYTLMLSRVYKESSRVKRKASPCLDL